MRRERQVWSRSETARRAVTGEVKEVVTFD